MGERNALVSEAAAILKRTHGVADSAAAQRSTRFGPNRVAADMEGNGEFDF